MTDLVHEVEIVSLPLRSAMVADRAEAALARVEAGQGLRPKDEQALRNALGFLREADTGERVLKQLELAEYSASAVSAFELAETASRRANLSGDFRSRFAEKIQSLLRGTPAAPQVTDVRSFFHELAEWCLRR